MNQLKLAGLYGEHFLKDRERFRQIDINDIPIMFGVDGSIICIPKKGEVFNVGFVAKRGRGKCLDKKTKVFTEAGIKEIKNIHIGDIVISYNTKRDEFERKKVLNKEKIISKNNIIIKTKFGEIICSYEHKFPVIDFDEIMAKDLNIDMKLIRNNKNSSEEVGINFIKKIDKEMIMYNLEIEDNHNFMLANTIITCNSLMAHSLCNNLFWNGDNIAVMNDSLQETFDWTQPQDYQEWIEQLGLIKQVPCPLPMIYVYQNTNKLQITKEYGVDYVKVTIPFEELIENCEKYMELGKSENYLRKLKDDLLDCEVPQEVIDAIEDKEEIPKSSKNKILSQFENIFNDEILHITNQEVPCQLSLNKNYINNPFSVIMKANCIPSFITTDIYEKRYKAQIFAYWINLLFQNQYSREFIDKRLFLFFDEITKICNTEEDNAAREALEQIPARGRQMKIGLIYCTQNYEKIPRIIQSNTDYIFAFRHSSYKEVGEIAKDFDVPKHIEKEMLKLDKLEVIGLTSDYFRIYKGGEVYEDDAPVKGRIIPPLSKHKNAQ